MVLDTSEGRTLELRNASGPLIKIAAITAQTPEAITQKRLYQGALAGEGSALPAESGGCDCFGFFRRRDILVRANA